MKAHHHTRPDADRPASLHRRRASFAARFIIFLSLGMSLASPNLPTQLTPDWEFEFPDSSEYVVLDLIRGSAVSVPATHLFSTESASATTPLPPGTSEVELVSRIQVFGDGRVLKTRPKGNRPFHATEFHIGRERVRQLLTEAASRGLFDLDEEELSRREAALTPAGTFYMISRHDQLTLRVNLIGLSRSSRNQETIENYTRVFDLGSLLVRSEFYPSLQELQDLRVLATYLVDELLSAAALAERAGR